MANIKLAADAIDDVLTYALFPQIGLKFLENRGNPAFEPAPTAASCRARGGKPEVYTVEVNGRSFVVQVSDGGDIEGIKPLRVCAAPLRPVRLAQRSGEWPPLAGNIFKVLVQPGQLVRRATW